MTLVLSLAQVVFDGFGEAAIEGCRSSDAIQDMHEHSNVEVAILTSRPAYLPFLILEATAETGEPLRAEMIGRTTLLSPHP